MGESGEPAVLLNVIVDRRGAQFAGSIRRPGDQAAVAFWGVMELLAALDQLVPAGPEPAEPPAAAGPAEDPR
jgi:hypothetical protein